MAPPASPRDLLPGGSSKQPPAVDWDGHPLNGHAAYRVLQALDDRRARTVLAEHRATGELVVVELLDCRRVARKGVVGFYWWRGVLWLAFFTGGAVQCGPGCVRGGTFQGTARQAAAPFYRPEPGAHCTAPSAARSCAHPLAPSRPPPLHVLQGR